MRGEPAAARTLRGGCGAAGRRLEPVARGEGRLFAVVLSSAPELRHEASAAAAAAHRSSR